MSAEPREGDREVAAILPNGRTVWLHVARPLASAGAMNHVARLASAESGRRRAEIAAQASAIERLSTAVVAKTDEVGRARLARIHGLTRRIAAGDRRLDARLRKARAELQSRFRKQVEIDRENLRRLRRRGAWDQILLATALPLFVAYGDRTNPLGVNNLTLALLLLVWLAGDQVVEAVFGSGTSKSPYALPDADAWSYIAPAANVLTAWWLLSDKQHERFITGVTTVAMTLDDPRADAGGVSYRAHVRVPLRDRMGADRYADFETFTGVAAVATNGSLRLSTAGRIANAQPQAPKARVESGTLRLSLRVNALGVALPPASSLGEIDIAWMVDTDKPCQTHRQ